MVVRVQFRLKVSEPGQPLLLLLSETELDVMVRWIAYLEASLNLCRGWRYPSYCRISPIFSDQRHFLKMLLLHQLIIFRGVFFEFNQLSFV